jgi:hypothetical protein
MFTGDNYASLKVHVSVDIILSIKVIFFYFFWTPCNHILGAQECS